MDNMHERSKPVFNKITGYIHKGIIESLDESTYYEEAERRAFEGGVIQALLEGLRSYAIAMNYGYETYHALLKVYDNESHFKALEDEFKTAANQTSQCNPDSSSDS